MIIIGCGRNGRHRLDTVLENFFFNKMDPDDIKDISFIDFHKKVMDNLSENNKPFSYFFTKDAKLVDTSKLWYGGYGEEPCYKVTFKGKYMEVIDITTCNNLLVISPYDYCFPTAGGVVEQENPSMCKAITEAIHLYTREKEEKKPSHKVTKNRSWLKAKLPDDIDDNTYEAIVDAVEAVLAQAKADKRMKKDSDSQKS